MRKRARKGLLIIAVLLVGCSHAPQQVSNELTEVARGINTTEVAKIDATEWEVKAREWPLGEERACVFFPLGNLAGCWETYDPSTGESYNRDDQPNDHLYLMKANLPENVKKALAEGHNQRAYCARDESIHLWCPRGGNISRQP